MEVIKTYIPEELKFFKSEDAIPNQMPLMMAEKPAEFSRPEDPMEVSRHMDFVEIKELEAKLLKKVQVDRTSAEKVFIEADAKLQYAKEVHKSAKTALEVMNENISKDVATIEAGVTAVTLEPERICRIYRKGHMYYYYEQNGILSLAWFRIANDKEKESFETGLFAQSVNE